MLPLNQNIQAALNLLKAKTENITDDMFIFHTTAGDKPLSRIYERNKMLCFYLKISKKINIADAFYL